jgi:hypothetical protein
MLNLRTLKDLNLSVSTALPAAGAAITGVGIDTVGVNPGRIPNVELFLEVPATPLLVDAKTIIYSFYDSADGVTYAAMADLPTVTSLGAGGVGAAAVSRRFKIPISARRYIAVNAAVLAAGGSNIAVSFTLSLVF